MNIKTPEKPRKPMDYFMRFRAERIDQLRAAYPNEDNATINRRVLEAFYSLPQKEMARYKREYREALAQYDAEFEIYKQNYKALLRSFGKSPLQEMAAEDQENKMPSSYGKLLSPMPTPKPSSSKMEDGRLRSQRSKTPRERQSERHGINAKGISERRSQARLKSASNDHKASRHFSENKDGGLVLENNGRSTSRRKRHSKSPAPGSSNKRNRISRSGRQEQNERSSSRRMSLVEEKISRSSLQHSVASVKSKGDMKTMRGRQLSTSRQSNHNNSIAHQPKQAKPLPKADLKQMQTKAKVSNRFDVKPSSKSSINLVKAQKTYGPTSYKSQKTQQQGKLETSKSMERQNLRHDVKENQQGFNRAQGLDKSRGRPAPSGQRVFEKSADARKSKPTKKRN